MDLELFDYLLPKEKIAIFPEKKGESRLLVCFKKNGEVRDEKFYNLGNFLDKNSLLVLNNTKVFKARIIIKLNNGKEGEILILRYKENEMECLIKPAKRILKEKKIYFFEGIESTSIEKKENGFFIIKTNYPVQEIIEKKGVPPLPPYIKRKTIKEDDEWYQTVYAKEKGSIAAPTAGLHFTKEIINKLKEKNIIISYLTLHIGIGTFKPIRSKNIENHKMEEEYYEISFSLSEKIEAAKKEKRKIIAVGTTTVRALESAYLNGGGRVLPTKATTDLFIYPPFKFNVIDGMITNFHLPKSTPLILVSSFAGLENIKKWYKEALELNYRFLSYGDAMLIL